MNDDLVKRLREESFEHSPGYNICDEAADRIEKLEAGEEEWTRICNRYADHYAARIEKLEAALRDCMEMAEIHEIPFRDRVMYISEIARKALGGKDG